MKILNISNDFYYSDLYRNFQNSLNKKEESNFFVPMKKFDKIIEENDKNVFSDYYISKIEKFFYFTKQRRLYKRITNKLQIESYDIIHSHFVFSSGYVAMKLSKKYNIPYIVSVRNTDINNYLKIIGFKYLYNMILKNSSAVIFINESYKEKSIDKYIYKKNKKIIENKAYVIPNGIDKYWMENIYHSKKINNNSNIKICTVGSVDKNKNQIKVMRACNLLREKGYNIEYIVIGPLIDKKIVKKLNECKNTKTIDKISFKDLLPYYRSSDIFVLPSYKETFGIVYIEAMSQGLPIIYSKGQGFDKQFNEGEVGYHVDPNSINDIAEKIELIIKEYIILSNNCINNTQLFDWDFIVDKYLKIYKGILKE